jgi:hypothetical protein
MMTTLIKMMVPQRSVAAFSPLAAACALALAAPAMAGTGTSAQRLQHLRGTSEQKLVADNGLAGDQFGTALASDGQLALVGAPGADIGANADQGAVYVFAKTGANWTQVAEITAPDGAAGDAFGSAVALSGTTAVIGAFTVDVGANSNQGAAYVFVNDGGTWSEAARLVSDDGAAFDNFGNAVALDGDTAMVGAINATVGGNPGQGAAYVFTADGGNWSQAAKLVALEGAAADQFGQAVGLSGGTALVAAPFADVAGAINQGATWVFTGSGPAWTEGQQLIAGDGADHEAFGNALALDGTTAVIGAYDASVDGGFDRGAAYVFSARGSSWTQVAKLVADDGMDSDQFGSAIALSGGTLVIGALNAAGGDGAAYRFTGSGDSWTQDATLAASDGVSGDHFGAAVALAGTAALAGAPGADAGDAADQGAAYIHSDAVSSGRSVDDFESGNPNAWGWANNNGLNGSVNPVGGHPDGWMDSGLPYFSDHPNFSSIPPDGSSLRAALDSGSLNSAAFDFQRLDSVDCKPFYDLPSHFTLELMDMHSDPGGAIVEAHTTDGPVSPGETAPWQTVAFTIPSGADTVPPGWTLNKPPELDYTWQDLMHNIDGARFFVIAPEDITYDACWHLGADNVIFSYGDAAPADSVFADGFDPASP